MVGLDLHVARRDLVARAGDSHPESIVEQALAHQIGGETTRAYRRGDAFLKRQRLMKDRAEYLYSTKRNKRRGSSADPIETFAKAA